MAALVIGLIELYVPSVMTQHGACGAQNYVVHHAFCETGEGMGDWLERGLVVVCCVLEGNRQMSTQV